MSEVTLLSELTKLGYNCENAHLLGIQLKGVDIPEITFYPYYNRKRNLYYIEVWLGWSESMLCGFTHTSLEMLMEYVEYFVLIILDTELRESYSERVAKGRKNMMIDTQPTKESFIYTFSEEGLYEEDGTEIETETTYDLSSDFNQDDCEF